MSETEKKYTERDIVMARRLGFVDGADFEMHAWQRFMHVTHRSGADSIEGARMRYPLPKIVRPRVVRDGKGVEWRVIGSTLEWRRAPCSWNVAAGTTLTLSDDHPRMWADLLACPTLIVDDDGEAV